jgi:tRNA(Glu) U13 pseudouridine synthase TruD
LDTNRHTEPLAIGKNRGNFFKITLGYQQTPPEEVKLKIEDHLAACKSEPIPNVF